MDSNMWFLFTSLLLVSAGANRYDQGPQRFYDVSAEYETAPQNENREVVVYLTPDQVKALEAGGAVVRSDQESENEVPDSELPDEPQVNEDQEETLENENDNTQDEEEEEEEVQQEEQEAPEDIENQELDFEEILRILNDEQDNEQETEAAEEPDRSIRPIEEENTESPRNFSPRITLNQQLQQQQEEKYLAPAVAKKEKILKSYSLIRYQPTNKQLQKINIQLLQQQSQRATAAEESSAEPQKEAPTQEKKKYKLVPYEVVETPAQEEIVEKQAQQEAIEEDDVVNARKNIIQNILKELKASYKYNDQKYAIELEKISNNVAKQNAALQAETVVKPEPAIINRQLTKKLLLNKAKPENRDAEPQKAKSLSQKPLTKPINVPVMKAVVPEVKKSIAVPVESGKRLSVKNVYVRTKTDKPIIISRRYPENKRQEQVELPTSRPERITILRHIDWDQ